MGLASQISSVPVVARPARIGTDKIAMSLVGLHMVAKCLTTSA